MGVIANPVLLEGPTNWAATKANSPKDEDAKLRDYRARNEPLAMSVGLPNGVQF